MACSLFSIMLLTALTAYQSDSANMTVRHRLHKSLLDPEKYDNDLRPVDDSNCPVVVTFGFKPILHHVDLPYQELQLRSKMTMTWLDERLTWNREDYDGLNDIDVPLHKIWKPDVTLYERLAKHSDESFKLENDIVKVHYTGDVNWTTVVTTKSFCLMAVMDFPFDNHSCYLSFLSMVYNENEQKLVVTSNETFKENEVQHAIWDLNSSVDQDSSCNYCPKGYSHITYVITLTRLNPSAIFCSLVLPCYAVALMSFFVILFGDDVPDAAGFGLTCILALIVFLSGFYDILPGTGLTFIGLYVMCTILFGMIMTLIVLCKCNSLVRRCCNGTKDFGSCLRRKLCNKSEEESHPLADYVQHDHGTFQENIEIRNGDSCSNRCSRCCSNCCTKCSNCFSECSNWFSKCCCNPACIFIMCTLAWAVVSFIVSWIVFQ